MGRKQGQKKLQKTAHTRQASDYCFSHKWRMVYFSNPRHGVRVLKGIKDMFDYINALLVQHPELLVKLNFLLMLKYWCFLILTGIFLYIAHFSDPKFGISKKTPARGTDESRFMA
jgi:hypothetical protein